MTGFGGTTQVAAAESDVIIDRMITVRAPACLHHVGLSRAGYRVAIHHNASARAGLERAVRATIDYELARGHGQAAALLLEDAPQRAREIPVGAKREMDRRGGGRRRPAAGIYQPGRLRL